MSVLSKQYITDEEGRKIGVILPLETYNRMLEDLEEQEDIRLYRAAKNEKQTFFEAGEVFKDIEESPGENV